MKKSNINYILNQQNSNKPAVGDANDAFKDVVGTLNTDNNTNTINNDNLSFIAEKRIKTYKNNIHSENPSLQCQFGCKKGCVSDKKRPIAMEYFVIPKNINEKTNGEEFEEKLN